MVRNSLRDASKADWERSPDRCGPSTPARRVATAEAEFEAFPADWREKYPAMIRSRENSWAEFVPFLEFPTDLRKGVYLVTTTKENRENMTGRIQGGKAILNTLIVHYGDRIADHVR